MKNLRTNSLVKSKFAFYSNVHYLGENPWRRLNSAPACFGAKDNCYGQFKNEVAGSIEGVKLVMVQLCGQIIASKCLEQIMEVGSTPFHSWHRHLFERHIQHHSLTDGSKFSLHFSGIWCTIQWNCLQWLSNSTFFIPRSRITPVVHGRWL